MDENIKQYFPHLLWVMRDFSLQITDENGKEITSNEYLEKSLTSKPLNQNQSKSKSRQLIRECFSNRDCVTLIRPAENEKDL